MRKAIWIAALGTLLMTGNALAEDQPGNAGGGAPATPPPKKAHHAAKYGTAGCGLGSLIITGGGIVQIFAATTNGTSGTQTFGITSGTSNCEDTDSGEESARVFVQANRVALAKDISRGSGETIDNLTALAGCADSKAVGSVLQHSFKSIFPTASVSSDQVSDTILSTLKADRSLACTAIGS